MVSLLPAVRQSRIKNIAVTLWAALLLAGCTPNYKIETRDWDDNNPTHYDFDLALPELRKEVLDLFSFEGAFHHPLDFDFTHEFHQSFFFETVDKAVFFDDIFSHTKNSNDIVLGPFRQAYWLSDVYIVNGKKAKTIASFHLHFSKQSENKTRVTVITIKPEVIHGLECCGPHGRYSRSSAVKTSTIEEYTLLRHIGSYLNLRLPKVKKPRLK